MALNANASSQSPDESPDSDAQTRLPDERLEKCMSLFATYQKRLSLFIAAMIPSPADADEVLQETNLVIWKKFDQFTPGSTPAPGSAPGSTPGNPENDPENSGSDFLSWAFRIAHFQALDYRKRMARKAQRMTCLSPEVMDQLSTQLIQDESLLDARRDALKTCLDKLPDAERTLVESCYAPEAQVAKIATELKRTPTSVYRSLRRIRQMLMECVQLTTGEKGVQA